MSQSRRGRDEDRRSSASTSFHSAKREGLNPVIFMIQFFTLGIFLLMALGFACGVWVCYTSDYPRTRIVTRQDDLIALTITLAIMVLALVSLVVQ